MREVDFKNLTDDDVEYIRQRPWLVNEAAVQGIDIKDRVFGDKESAESESESESASSEGDGEPSDKEGSSQAGEFESVHDIVAPPDEPVDNPDPDSDDYDDTGAWSTADLRNEVKERKEAMTGTGASYDGPALNASRASLISWLRMDNGRE